MGFWSNRAAEANERRVERYAARGEARGERIAARADRARASRVRNGTRTPLRANTWISGRGKG